MLYQYRNRLIDASVGYLITLIFLLGQTLWAIPAKAEVPKVMASIIPVHSLVAAVMDGVGNPELIVPGTQSPHTFTLKPSQAKALQQADLIFLVSRNLERFLEKPLSNLSQPHATIELIAAPGLTLHPFSSTPTLEKEYEELEAEEASEAHHDHEVHEHKETDTDPHIWLDPGNAIRMIQTIANALSQVDSTHTAIYQKNTKMVIERLKKLDTELSKKFATAKTRQDPKTIAYLTFHDAYQYVEKRYDLRPSPYLTENPESGVTARDLHAIEEIESIHRINCIFSEPAFDADIVKRLSEKYKAPIHVLNPDGSLLTPGQEAYETLLRTITDTMLGCMR